MEFTVRGLAQESEGLQIFQFFTEFGVHALRFTGLIGMLIAQRFHLFFSFRANLHFFHIELFNVSLLLQLDFLFEGFKLFTNSFLNS